MSATTDVEATPAPAAEARYYGFSVLFSGIAKMWRAWAPSGLFIILNAVIQAGLITNDPVAGWSWSFLLLCFASAVFLLLTGAVLSAGALLSATGPAPFGTVMTQMRSNFGLFAGWVILQTIVVSIGYAFYTWPGSILWLITVFIPIAAIDGQGNALTANFRAIASHPFRWIITAIIVGIISGIGFLFGALNTFFIGGYVGSVLASLIGGVFAWWWLTSWACLYCSRKGADQPA